ncbi:E4 SUMO-protein ligase PIAL2-like [Cynara cardunculus var. scolymus]|uniref:E4 SUMO-protein ligase PIAL2-like n=1 Tax=Cynara cardunculus var. scolymus TaxID=59895 RepID=UPI000D62D272|nr:E4 SUMO-protein ligase PIAL2-like [Cynara cardunculus var. scolymus]
MAGTVINPAPVTRTVAMSTGQTPSSSYVNSFRISAVVDRLLVHVGDGSKSDKNEFFNLCLSLARGIDYAVAHNEIPVRAPDLPYLLKQLCQRRDDTLLHAAIMVLLISIKSACRNGWFDAKDSEELHILLSEIASSFCSVEDMNSEEGTLHRNISTVMSRFYPRMRMGKILVSVEAKQGYGTFVNDFYITKKTISSDDKICLFVAQTDNMETSSCIISPQQVNFLLNGRAVDRRTCAHKDTGPQNPTLVTHMLKYGTNLLQAVGQFYGKYIIVVAFMSKVPIPSCPSLPDYVPPPPAAAPDSSDNDIIEGPSRISLNCPISFKRIKTPVKGQLCKHLQCFDFDNYLGMNSRRPLWRCPHCSQSVCFVDIRVDQNMVKVLKEVLPNVSHVSISADGSWEVVSEGDDHSDKPQDKAPLHQESTISTGADILDLTEGDTDMDASNSRHNDDSKPSPAQLQAQLINYQNGSYVNMNNTSNENGTYPTPARLVTRNPIAVQALPVQTSAGMVSDDRTRQSSRFRMNSRQVSRMISALPSPDMGSQNWVHHDLSHVSSQPVQQFGPCSGPPLSGHWYPSALPADRFNSHHNQPSNQRIPNPIWSLAQLPPQVCHGGVGPTSNQQFPHYAMDAAQQAIQIRSMTPSVQAPVQTSVSSVPVASSEVQGGEAPRVLEGSADENQRPARRMRGSLSGRDYSDALNRLIIHPTQPVQAARPPVLNAPRPALPPHLQVLMANNINARGSQGGANGSVLDSSNGDTTAGVLLPEK